MTRLEFIECLWRHDACRGSINWLRKRRGSPQSLILRARPDWCEWLAHKALPSSAREEFFDSVWRNTGLDTAFVMKDAYSRAELLDNWPRVEAWLRKDTP